MSSGAESSEPARSTAARSPYLIAMYLPQFHPIPENDEWWGPGFTEWTNVAKARPLFPGHHQPNLPADLGFYDLRLPDVRAAQAELARTNGIDAFCYWHYWFGGGRTILERPFAEVLASGEPDFPFCLGWANESWGGRWVGATTDVLIEQSYPGADDHRRHFDSVLPALTDPRYVTVDGRPLVYLYRPNDLPDGRRFTDLWRELARAAGLPDLYLVGQTRSVTDRVDAAALGLDAVATWDLTPRPLRWRSASRGRSPDAWVTAASERSRLLPRIFSYEHWAPHMTWMQDGSGVSLPSVVPNWDNTPRMGRRGLVFVGSTPERFGLQLERAAALVSANREGERIVFVRSWNEWAEGNYLEPDQRYGHAYLDAVRAFRDQRIGSEAGS